MCKSFIKGIALLLVILFFVPTTVVSCENEYGSFFTMKLSAYGLSTGNIKIDSNFPDSELEETTQEAKEGYTGNLFLFTLLILPIVIFVSSTDHLFRTFLCTLLNMIIMISMNKNYIPLKLESTGYLPYLTLERTAAYTIHIILSIIIMLVSAYEIYKILKEPNEEDTTEIICECGATIKINKAYSPTHCPMCGRPRNETEKTTFIVNTDNEKIETTIKEKEDTNETLNSDIDT